MSGLYYALNPGGMLRRLFPKQLNTQAFIIIWTVIFVLNIIVTVLIQNFVIYKISDFSEEGLEKTSYFRNCDVQNIKNTGNGDYSVVYVNENGELRIVCLDRFPANIFARARVMKSTDMEILEDGTVQYKKGGEIKSVSKSEYVELANPDSMVDMLWQNRPLEKLTGVYLAIGFVMLMIEFFFYNVFHKLFRE